MAADRKERDHRYVVSEKGRARRRRANAKYRSTPKGQLTEMMARARRKAKEHIAQLADLTGDQS